MIINYKMVQIYREVQWVHPKIINPPFWIQGFFSSHKSYGKIDKAGILHIWNLTIIWKKNHTPYLSPTWNSSKILGLGDQQKSSSYETTHWLTNRKIWPKGKYVFFPAFATVSKNFTKEASLIGGKSSGFRDVETWSKMKPNFKTNSFPSTFPLNYIPKKNRSCKNGKKKKHPPNHFGVQSSGPYFSSGYKWGGESHDGTTVTAASDTLPWPIETDLPQESPEIDVWNMVTLWELVTGCLWNQNLG